jgi:glutamate N-acetyltransferase / amino-acid N-acetyltransferase
MSEQVIALPLGFSAHVANIGIKDDTDDLVIVRSERPCAAAGLFTQSRFAGPSVVVSRQHLADGSASAVVVISKNANVATGADGLADAHEVVQRTAEILHAAPNEVLIASTGVIGRRYPMDRVRAGLNGIALPFVSNDAMAVARAIMTTDTHPKVATARIGAVSVVGVAKGVGMIEPDMATLITLLFTDADVDSASLQTIFRRVIERTFNCVSVDTDTSTSDTAIILANGAAGRVDLSALESEIETVAMTLTKMVARDGEGATKLLEVRVDHAADPVQAKTVAKAIVNSPLVKTAVHGADPNWGRVAMAIGKCSQYADIDEQSVVIRFGDQELYPTRVDVAGLERLSEYLRGNDVLIHVSLHTGMAEATVWGCDLSDGYIRINADYTT